MSEYQKYNNVCWCSRWPKSENRSSVSDKTKINSDKHSSVSTSLNPNTQIAVMMISVVSFIVAISWNELVKNILMNKYKKKEPKVYFIYATSVTVMGALIIYYISKYTNKTSNINKNQNFEHEEEDIIF